MNWTILKSIGEYIKNYTAGQAFGYFRLAVDVLIIVAAVVVIYRILMKYTNRRILLVITACLAILFGLIILLDLQILYKLYPIIVLAVFAVLIYFNASKIRAFFGDITKSKNAKNFMLDESAQEELISTLIKSVEYLSSRQIGAIITIEKQDSLNTYINKGTKLNAEITFELLSTIFMPGTALHDGAVIIRGKHIMCAAAFYPSTDKNDIPKNYGSRHRAAIGISEVTDAFTIVVSEETGRIALTLDGTLTPDVSLESLRVYLKQNIIVE